MEYRNISKTMLTFITSMSLDDFKEIKGHKEIEVKKNLKTGKYFFTCGDETGAVSDKFITGEFKNPVISQVESDRTGEVFFLLHSRDEGGSKTIIKL